MSDRIEITEVDALRLQLASARVELAAARLAVARLEADAVARSVTAAGRVVSIDVEQLTAEVEP